MSTLCEKYATALHHVVVASPRQLPLTDDAFADLTPHLATQERQQLLRSLAPDKMLTVALPPLRINHCYHTIRLEGPCTTAGHESGRRFAYSGVVRLPQSYTRFTPTGTTKDTLTADVAVEYAQSHWLDALVLDDSVSVIESYLQDPSEQREVDPSRGGGLPVTRGTIIITINQNYGDLHSETTPRSRLVDDAIVAVSWDPLISAELKGRRPAYLRFHCSRCASGLYLTECPGCQIKFRDNGVRAGGWMPLPPKVVAYLQETGHKFVRNPQLAYKAEEKIFNDNRVQLKKRLTSV